MRKEEDLASVLEPMYTLGWKGKEGGGGIRDVKEAKVGDLDLILSYVTLSTCLRVVWGDYYTLPVTRLFVRVYS